MSIQATGWVRQTKIRPPSDKFILFVLADYCNSFGLAYPSATRLADDTGYDRKTVFAALKRLRDKKLIVDTGKRVGKTQQVVVYKLPWADIDPEGKGGLGGTVPKAEQFRGDSKASRGDSKASQSTLENHQEPLGTTSTPAGGYLLNGEEEQAAKNMTEYAQAWSRIATLFNRKLTTQWSDKEKRAFKKLCPIDEDELTMIERYYAAERKRTDHHCRRDLYTFLNNYRGEVDRAYAYCQRHPLPGQRKVKAAPPKPPELTDEQVAKNCADVHKLTEGLRQRFKMPESERNKAP
jgi:hypothetical protein